MKALILFSLLVHPVRALLALGPSRADSLSSGLAFDAPVSAHQYHVRSAARTGSCGISTPGAAPGVASLGYPSLRRISNRLLGAVPGQKDRGICSARGPRVSPGRPSPQFASISRAKSVQDQERQVEREGLSDRSSNTCQVEGGPKSRGGTL